MNVLDWDHLRVFLAVARQGQMLAAARSLGVNHATIARRLDALEDALGAPLFDRRPTGSLLTEAGERLLPAAERVETEILGIVDQSRAEGASVSGTVRIGAPDGLGTMFLAAELGLLQRDHPALVVELVPLPRNFSLSKREADLAICLDPPAEGRLLVTRLTDYSLGVYAARSYLAQHGTPETLADLDAHTVVTGVEDYAYAPSLDYGLELVEQAGRLFRCAGVMGQMQAVRAGVGIGILHDFAVGAMPELVRIMPAITWRRSYHLLAHPDSHALARIAACRNVMVRRFREERARFLPFG